MPKQTSQSGGFGGDGGSSLKLRIVAGVALMGLAASLFLLFGPRRPLAKELVVGTDHSPPFQVVNPDGTVGGIIVEAVREAAKQAGIKLTFRPMNVRPEQVLADETQGVDLWPMVTVTPERRLHFHLTQPIGTAEYQIGFIHDPTVDPATYQPRRIAITSGQWLQGKVDAAFPDAQPVYVQAGSQLAALCSGAADAMISDSATLYTMGLLQLPECSGKRIVSRLLPDWSWDLAIGSTFAKSAEADRIRAEFGKIARSGRLHEIFAEFPLHAQYRSYDTFAETHSEEEERRMQMALVGLCLSCGCLLFMVILSRRRAREALALVQQKSIFVDRISHELRTPLNGVLGLASLLETTPLTPMQHDYLRLIQQSGEELLKLVTDLLDFSKLEARKQSVQAEAVDLRQLVEDTVAMLTPVAEQRKLELSWVVSREVPELIRTDRRAIRQLLINLLANGIKYTPSGRVQVSLSMAGKEAGYPFIRCNVDDSGPGVAKQDRARVFQSFVRLDRDAQGGAVGTGLGLSIARELVLLMNGNIGVTDGPLGGARFWFEFPVQVHTSGDQRLQDLQSSPKQTQQDLPDSDAADETDTPDSSQAPSGSAAPVLRKVRLVTFSSTTKTNTAAELAEGSILRMALERVQLSGAAKQDVVDQSTEIRPMEMLLQHLEGSGTEVVWQHEDGAEWEAESGGSDFDLLVLHGVTDAMTVQGIVSRARAHRQHVPVIIYCGAEYLDCETALSEIPFSAALRLPFTSGRFDRTVQELFLQISYQQGVNSRAPASRAISTPADDRRIVAAEVSSRESSISSIVTNVSALPVADGSTGTKDLAGKIALVADDNRVNQVVLASMLRQLGMRCDVVSDGLEAIAACSEKQYDYLFLDHHMPNLDGVNTAIRLRKRSDWRRTVPIIASSAVEPGINDEIYREAGVDDILPKPFTVDDLRRCLKIAPLGGAEKEGRPTPAFGNHQD